MSLRPWVGIVAVLILTPAWGEDSGCNIASPHSGMYTLDHGGVTRTYALRIPPSYNPRLPTRVVLVFHGWGGDETEFLNDTAVQNESDRRGYILVAPRGLGSGAPDNSKKSWTFRGSDTGVIRSGRVDRPICDTSITSDHRYPSCRNGVARNSCSWTQCQDDDVAFVHALIQHVKSRLCVDTDRIFAAGGSNGGMFMWELGEDPRTAPMIRAIAPIIGLPHGGDLRPPARKDGMPVLLITGASDTTVPPGTWDSLADTTSSNHHDRYFYTGASAVIRRWSTAAGCPTNQVEKLFKTPASGVECRTYCSTADDAWPTVLDCRTRTGHDYDLRRTWPLILDFFDRL